MKLFGDVFHFTRLNVQFAFKQMDRTEWTYTNIFTSLEIMLECLKDDLLAHEGKGVFQTKMTYPRLIADFM